MKNGNSVLHQAVLSKNLFMVQLIAKSIKPEYMDDKNFYGDSPLMISVMTNQLEITKFLVDLKCNINSTENNGATPFIGTINYHSGSCCIYWKFLDAKIFVTIERYESNDL
jgi:ankyrin repeat protein